MPTVVHGVGWTSRMRAPTVGPHRLVQEGELSAIVSDVEEPEVLPTRLALRTHRDALDLERLDGTVVPLRFGTVLADDAQVRRELLAANAPAWHATLDRLAGHVELRLRGTFDEPELLRHLVATDRRIARLRGRRGRELELGEQVVAAIDRQREEVSSTLERSLAPVCADLHLDPPAEPLDAATVSCLVSDQQRAAFERAVDDLGARVGPVVSFELIGPLPPFSFAELAEVPA